MINIQKNQSLLEEFPDLQEANQKKFPVRIFKNKRDYAGKEKLFYSFSELITYLDAPFKLTMPKVAKFLKTKDNANAIIFGITNEYGRRKNKGEIVTRNALAIDIDKVFLNGNLKNHEQIVNKLTENFEYNFYVHTTSSSTLKKPCYRLIVPLSSSISASEYPRAIKKFVKTYIDTSLFKVDPSCEQASRIMFVPFIPSSEYREYSM